MRKHQVGATFFSENGCVALGTREIQGSFSTGTPEPESTGQGGFFNRFENTLKNQTSQVHHQTRTCLARKFNRSTCHRQPLLSMTDGGRVLQPCRREMGHSLNHAQRRPSSMEPTMRWRAGAWRGLLLRRDTRGRCL